MKAVSLPFVPLANSKTGGGGVDVEEANFRSSAFPGVFYHDSTVTYHKSVLAARSAPERLTIFGWTLG